jgi:hypothetical protein
VDGPAPVALITAVLGLLAAYVVYGRWLRADRSGSARP